MSFKYLNLPYRIFPFFLRKRHTWILQSGFLLTETSHCDHSTYLLHNWKRLQQFPEKEEYRLHFVCTSQSIRISKTITFMWILLLSKLRAHYESDEKQVRRYGNSQSDLWVLRLTYSLTGFPLVIRGKTTSSGVGERSHNFLAHLGIFTTWT